MNWLIDIVLAAIIVIIILVNTKKGCLSIFNLLTPIAAFGSAYFVGPILGKDYLHGTILQKVTEVIHKLLTETVQNTVEVNPQNPLEALPDSILMLIEKAGINAEELAGLFLNPESFDLAAMTEKLAAPVANGLSIALGCVIAFVGAWILMLIVKLILSLLVKLPVLKQTSSLIGFVFGCVNAFAVAWALCILVGMLLEYSLLGDYNAMLASAAQDTILFRFFCNLTISDFIYILPGQQ